MADIFKAGDLVRVRSAEPTATGKVTSTDGGYVSVEYQHDHGPVTKGYYPATHLERVEKTAGEKAGERESGKTNPTVTPRATTEGIINESPA